MCHRVESFCCGCSLQAGAITATVITFFVALILLALGCDGIAGAELLKQNVEEMEKKGITPQDLKFFEAAGGIALIIGVLTFIIFITLAVGISKKRSRCVMPWLVCYMMNLASCIINTVLVMLGGNFKVAGSIAYIFLGYYMWVVVFSYYKQLQEEEDQEKTTV